MRLIDANPFGVIALQGKSKEFIEGVNFVLDKIYDAPTVEQQSIEWGKWVISEVRCPECLEYFDPEGFSKEEMDKCPNCGADMRVKNELNQVNKELNKELNSEIEKSKSEIVPDYRDGWRLKNDTQNS